MTVFGPEYAFWEAALAGKEQTVESGKPQVGFYEYRRGGDRQPVAIFRRADGSPVATLGREEHDLTESFWLAVCKRPIGDDVYWHFIDHGVWPDTNKFVAPEPEVSTMPGAIVPFGNAPDTSDPLDDLKEQIENAVGALNALLSDGVTTKADADRLANAKDRLGELWSQCETQRKKEKKPHDDAAAAVQIRWRPVVTAAHEGREKAQGALTVWQKAERKRLEEEAAAAKRKADEARKAAEEEARRAAEEGREPAPAPPEAVEPPAIIDTRPRSGGAISGRRSGLREVNARAGVDDWVVLYEHLATNEEWLAAVRNLAQDFADRAARAKSPLPGTRRITEEKAV